MAVGLRLSRSVPGLGHLEHSLAMCLSAFRLSELVTSQQQAQHQSGASPKSLSGLQCSLLVDSFGPLSTLNLSALDGPTATKLLQWKQIASAWLFLQVPRIKGGPSAIQHALALTNSASTHASQNEAPWKVVLQPGSMCAPAREYCFECGPGPGFCPRWGVLHCFTPPPATGEFFLAGALALACGFEMPLSELKRGPLAAGALALTRRVKLLTPEEMSSWEGARQISEVGSYPFDAETWEAVRPHMVAKVEAEPLITLPALKWLFVVAAATGGYHVLLEGPYETSMHSLVRTLLAEAEEALCALQKAIMPLMKDNKAALKTVISCLSRALNEVLLLQKQFAGK